MMRSLIITILMVLATRAYSLDRIALSPDHASFIHTTTQKPFHPWGLNYDRDFHMRLLEDYWQTEWPTVVEHFAEMKRLGANVVRIHLQVARFMDAPDKPNSASLAQLQKLLDIAEKNGLYLDLTGLACYRRADVPDWYTNLDEPARWQAQERFWSAIAQTCSRSPAVLCYDLVNEPSVPAQPRKPRDWLAGDLAGFTYCQVITLDPKDRDRTRLATDWVDKMTAAIRQHDRQILITVGLLPFPQGTGFDPEALADHLDFISVHYYPKSANLDDQAQFLKKFATAKPLVVEEIFPLSCTPVELGQFMQKSPFVTGWVGFYWGHRQQDLQKSTSPGDALVAGWLEFFQAHNPHATNN